MITKSTFNCSAIRVLYYMFNIIAEYAKYIESPESKIIPSEDINTVQHKISGEKLPEIILELCDSCHWSLICFNKRGVLEKCPDCSRIVSQIPMNIDEICSITYDNTRGVSIRFDRKKPMR